MHLLMRTSRRLGPAALALALIASSASAQRDDPPAAPAPAAPFVTGFGNFSPMVADLDRTIAFYCDALGLTLSAAESTRPVPWDTEGWHRDLHGSQGSPMRFVTARVPGTRLGVEMVEQGAIERHPVTLHIQDPGNVMVVLLVRDVDRIAAAARGVGAPVVTAGGAPIDLGTNLGRAVVVRDPDTHLVEFLQPNRIPETTAPADSNGNWEKGAIPRGNVGWATISDVNNVFLVVGDRQNAGRGRGTP